MAGGPQRCEKHNQLHCMKCLERKGSFMRPVGGFNRIRARPLADHGTRTSCGSAGRRARDV